MRQSNPDLVAREYETVTRLAERRLDRTAWLRGTMEWSVAVEAVAEVRPRRVLDAGCGTADFSALIAAPEVICVDSSQAAVDAARSRGLEARRADIDNLPFDDAEFDVVTCNWVLYHLANRDRGIAELARVLRPGGRFVGMYNFPDHLQEVWDASGASWDPDGFDSESGMLQLAPRFARVERIETRGEALWEDRDALQAYLDAFHELAGILVAPSEPYPFRSTRHNCVFVADTA